jgi:hypothetical protein
VLVLNSVGYSVEACPTLPEFRSAIKQRTDADAVLVVAEPRSAHREVISLTRDNTQARLILFDRSYSSACEAEFDLVITPQTLPEDWLRLVAAVIDHSRALSAMAAAVRERSALLRKDSEIARLKSVIERERSATARAKAKGLFNRIRRSDPSS